MTNKEQYFAIINFRLNTPLPDGVYGEQHHIVPKSICPILQKAPQNLVLLTAQEHFKAHYYLWKWFVDEGETKWAKKMLFAFHMMKKQLTKCDNIEPMSKLYEESRLSFTQALSELHKKRKRRNFTQDERKKMSDSHKGKKLSNEQKLKIGESNRGKKHRPHKQNLTDAQRKRISERMKARWQDPKYKQRVREKMISNWLDEEVRQRRIDGITKANNDPERKEMRVERVKKSWNTRKGFNNNTNVENTLTN